MPVIVVGRGPVGACDGSERGCGETLAVDLLAWADGAPFDPGPVFDAGLEVPPSAIAYRHLAAAEALVVGWSGSVLIAAAVRPATVEAIDPEAAAAMTATGASPAGLVWYVRGLETEYGPARYMTSDVPPRMRWVVLDESTGSPIVTGVVDRPDGASTRGDATGSAFPATVAGLPVRDVATVIAARADVPAGRIAAVAGWLRAWADPSACLDPIDGLPAGGCPRTGLLIGAPWSDAAGTPPEGAGAVIHVEVPPGVALPDVAVGIEVEEKGPPPPVVALGRYDEAGSFVVEAVAWVSGQSLAPGRVVARDVAAAADDPIAAEAGARRDALDGATAVLRMVLDPARALAAIDPEAAARMRTAGRDAAAPLWYLRGLTASGTVTWAVVEPGTGRVLARADAG
jgi:hypothetical protein